MALSDFRTKSSNIAPPESVGEPLKVIEWDHMDLRLFYPFALTSTWAVRTGLYPLAVLRSRMQLQKQTTVYRNTMHAYRDILQQEGLRGLYRGFWVTVPQIGCSLIYSTVYEKLRADLQNNGMTSVAGVSSIAGGAASFASQVIFVPTDIVAQYMMVHKKADELVGMDKSVVDYVRSEKVRHKSHSRRVIEAVYRIDGLSGFYRGFWASSAVYVPTCLVFWPVYYWLQDSFNKLRVRQKQSLLVDQAAAATLGSLCSTVATNPMETFRIRVQVHRTSYSQTLSKMLREEGFSIFTKGLPPRLLSNSIYTCVVMVGYEVVKRLCVLPEYRHLVRCSTVQKLKFAIGVFSRHGGVTHKKESCRRMICGKNSCLPVQSDRQKRWTSQRRVRRCDVAAVEKSYGDVAQLYDPEDVDGRGESRAAIFFGVAGRPGPSSASNSPQFVRRKPTSSKSSVLSFRRVISTIFYSRQLRRAKQAESEQNAPQPTEEVVSLLLQIRLQSGHQLPVKDASGSSDPYVKFKYRDALVYRSSTIFKNLNPVWEEEFQMLVEDIMDPLLIEVFDFDRFCSDDFMGNATLDLSQVKWTVPTEMQVQLKDENGLAAGRIILNASVLALTQIETHEFKQKASRTGVFSPTLSRKKEKPVQTWTKVINVVLVEGKNIRASSGDLPDPFFKFKLGQEKYKTKVCQRTSEPKWIEQFDMHVFESGDELLQMVCVDRVSSDVIGRLTVDVAQLAVDDTVQRWFPLETSQFGAEVLLLLTVSATPPADAVVDFAEFNYNDVRNALIEKYDWKRSFANSGDVGTLSVKVYAATDLQAKDIGGKSDPFVVLELVNTRLQTHTEYKTLNPEWNKIFTFKVKDVHVCLEVTVYDEDPNNKFEFLGKVAIPLLTIRNCEKRWFALKDRKLKSRVKGEILLEMDLIWNQVRAAFRTFKPKEHKFVQQEQKFKASILRAAVSEVKELVMVGVDLRNWVQSVFDWDSTPRTVISFVVFLIAVVKMEIYHLPCLLLCFLAKNYVVKRATIPPGESWSTVPVRVVEDDDKSGTSSLRDTIFSIQDTLTLVQQSLIFVLQLVQRIRRTFDFSNPWLSTLAVLVLSVAVLLLYCVPIRWVILVWGVNKFTKKLRNPNFVDNNEILDFLSRVPCDNDLEDWENKRLARNVTSP
ncbi:unnamed protein product [Caenorhabditis auriculariae]|uniref:C2 domain-containing protein n=1 Tax=Caenorhabditis auriculariae TaxID=2777116 RepID=A0A8S1GNG2_9PELO|nr:unnamed protein product [Caenorhabditis auriculariae]